MHWVSRAATLSERLPLLGRSPGEPHRADLPPTASTEILSAWCTSVADGDDERFARRLSWLGLDGADVERLAALGADVERLAALGAGGETAAWAPTAFAAQAQARRSAGDLAVDDDAAWKLDTELAYAALWRPWVMVAGAAARARVPHLDGAILDELAAELAVRLAGLGERAVHEAFLATGPVGEDPGPYRRWVLAQLHDGLEALCVTYPVLGRVLAIAVDHWVDASIELCERLVRDREALEVDLGIDRDDPVVHIDALGDAHEAGRQVLLLVTATGARVIYKPRSIEPEMVFARAAERLRANGGVDVALTPRMIERAGYGWSEYVTMRGCADAEELAAYSRRAGAALALAHVLAVTDLHLENVVAAGDRPVLIDLECIASAPLRDRGAVGLPQPLTFAQSVLSTCLLPMPSGDRSLAVDIAGLTATDAQVAGERAATWLGLGTSAIRIERRATKVWSTVVRPSSAQPPVDLDEVLAGLTHALEVLAVYGTGVDLGVAHEHRVVLRDTQAYADLLHAALAPGNLRDGLRFSVALDAAARDALAADAGAWRAPLAELERRSLEALDVPLATGDWASTALRVGGVEIPDVLVASGTDMVQALAASLDESGVQLQRGIAQIALEVRLATPARVAAPPARGRAADGIGGPVDVLDACRSIGQHLAATAVEVGDGSVQWLNAIMQRDERVAAGLGGPGLYTGSGGVAIFLAGLAAHTGEAGLADLARRAVSFHPGDDLALADGLAGQVYAAATVGALLGDPAMVHAATRRLVDVMRDDAGPAEVDLMAGHGGMVLALAAAAAISGSGGAVDVARRSAHELRRRWAAQRARDVVQANRAERLGLAHGIGGTSLAVARVLALGSDPVLEHWLAELLDAENARIDRRGGAPCRVTSDAARRPDTTWCWGTAGFAIGRRAIVEITGAPAARRHLARADEINDAAPSALHRLCCGSAGTIEAQPAGETRTARTRGLVGAIGAYALETGTSFQNASLFRGVAGIGYTLLRTVAPDLPSVLCLAPAGSGR